MMMGRMVRPRPKSSMQSRPGSSVGRPGSSMGRPQSRAESRMAPRPPSSIGERPQTRLKRTDSRLDRRDSTLTERPKTAHDRMRNRIDQMNEARAHEKEQRDDDPDVDCSTKMKALWLLFSGSFLPKAFSVVGGVVLLFGIVMLVIGYATDSFESGKTIGPALAIVGLFILIVGLLGLKTAFSNKKRVGQQDDVEKGKNEDDIKSQKVAKSDTLTEKQNKANVLSFAPAEDSDSEIDQQSKPLDLPRWEKKNNLSARSDASEPVVGVARPRTLPPLQVSTKAAGQKKRKKKTPRQDLSASLPHYDGRPVRNISTISSDNSYGIRGAEPGYSINQTYGLDNSDNENSTYDYRSKAFNYE